MLECDAVVEHLDEVGSDLDARHVDHDRVRGVTGLGGPCIVEGDHPEPEHEGGRLWDLFVCPVSRVNGRLHQEAKTVAKLKNLLLLKSRHNDIGQRDTKFLIQGIGCLNTAHIEEPSLVITLFSSVTAGFELRAKIPKPSALPLCHSNEVK